MECTDDEQNSDWCWMIMSCQCSQVGWRQLRWNQMSRRIFEDWIGGIALVKCASCRFKKNHNDWSAAVHSIRFIIVNCLNKCQKWRCLKVLKLVKLSSIYWIWSSISGGPMSDGLQVPQVKLQMVFWSHNWKIKRARDVPRKWIINNNGRGGSKLIRGRGD